MKYRGPLGMPRMLGIGPLQHLDTPDEESEDEQE